MFKFFSYDPEYGIMGHDTLALAAKSASRSLHHWRRCATAGKLPAQALRICYGEIKGSVVETQNDDGTTEYQLEER